METKTVELKKYNGREGRGVFRAMTLEEVLSLRPGDTIWFRTMFGDARRAKVNGKIKTWKRAPGKFEIPLKYGLYEYCHIDNALISRLLVEVEEK
jgi:hypothetical protein